MPDAQAIAVAIIPARFGSTRLPGKPLADIAGRPMIERVYARAVLSRSLARVIVATDDGRIVRALDGKAEVSMTRYEHSSGTDRVAEIASGLDVDIVVNIQGDLPLLDPEVPDALVEALRADSALEMTTPAVPIRSSEEFHDPSVVKVVCSADGNALYFSRAAIPHDRDGSDNFGRARHHIGIYAYRKETLLRFAALRPSPLERIEKLEQLRALENGIAIRVVPVRAAPMEVDTEADLQRARAEYTRLERDGGRS